MVKSHLICLFSVIFILNAERDEGNFHRVGSFSNFPFFLLSLSREWKMRWRCNTSTAEGMSFEIGSFTLNTLAQRHQLNMHQAHQNKRANFGSLCYKSA
jgi:hypothetical protein